MSVIKRKDLVIPRGATVKKAWPVRTADKQPADLAGFSARMQVRDIVTDERYLNLLPIEEYGNVAGMYMELPDRVVMYLPADALDSATWKSGKYDIEIFQDNTVIRLVQGKIRIIKDATHL